MSGSFRDRRVVIIGGLGFIGSNLARRLVERGAEVLLVDTLAPDQGGNLFNIDGIENKVRVSTVDVRDEQLLYDLVQGRDYLFNLVGQTSHLDSMRDPYTDLEMNCRAQLSILEACRKRNPDIKVVFASTRQVYGCPEYLPVDERHPLHPVDVNGVNKMAGEWYHLVYRRVYGVRSCVLRLTNTYGPRMRVKDARQTFLGLWIRRVVEGKAIDVFGDGRQMRDLNYVEDVVEALLLAATSDEARRQIFNLGADDPISLRDLAALLIETHGSGEHRLVPFPAEHKAIDIGSYYADYRRIRTTLGWAPKIPLRQGLAEALDYYRTHGQRYWEEEA